MEPAQSSYTYSIWQTPSPAPVSAGAAGVEEVAAGTEPYPDGSSDEVGTAAAAAVEVEGRNEETWVPETTVVSILFEIRALVKADTVVGK